MRATKRLVSMTLSLVLALAMVLGCTTAMAAVLYPPVSTITTDYTGSFVEFKTDGTDAWYEVHMPGATPAQLSDVDLTVTSTVTGVNRMWLQCGSVQGYREGAGNILLEGCDLSVAEPELFIAWGPWIGEAQGDTYPLVINTAAISVDLPQITITPSGGTALDVASDSSTVGGVTRYFFTAEFPSGTTTASLQNATVSFTSGATVDLKVGGVSKTDGGSGGTHTFTGVNFISGGGVTITLTGGGQTREYTVNAYVEGSSISVKIAIRTFTALNWLNEDYSEYDYAAEGYGTPSDYDLTPTEINNLTDAAEGLAFAGNDHTWVMIGGKQRVAFDSGDYVTLILPSGSTVMDALMKLADDEGFGLTGAGSTNYISKMTFNGHDLGEFDCGFGSGWMYTVKPYGGTTWLPNMGAYYYTLAGGEEIDWIYTAAYGADFGWPIWDM